MNNYHIKIAPCVDHYKKQIDYYNWTAYETITNELVLILPIFPKQKGGIITSPITGFIGLAYEGLSSFVHYKKQKALHKAVQVMENKVDLQCKSLFGSSNGHVWYIYSDTLETLIDTVHRLHNQTTWNEKLFAGKIEDWYHW